MRALISKILITKEDECIATLKYDEELEGYNIDIIADVPSPEELRFIAQVLDSNFADSLLDDEPIIDG